MPCLLASGILCAHVLASAASLPAAATLLPAAADSTVLDAVHVVQPRPLPAPPARNTRALERAGLILVAGGVAAVWASGEDEPVEMRRALDRPPWEVAADVGNVYGNGAFIGGASALVYGTGVMVDDPAVRALGGDLLESFALTSAVTYAVKVGVNRHRPSGGGHSFPSGHTAVAFCVAPVLQHHLGWWAAAPAALLAVTTAAGRLEDSHHYMSDTVFGASVGLACGSLVAGEGLFGLGRARVVAAPDRAGVVVPF